MQGSCTNAETVGVDDFFYEELPEVLSNGHVRVTGGDFELSSASRVELHRNDDFDLILKLIEPRRFAGNESFFEAGTDRQATEAIQFTYIDGSHISAEGVTDRGYS